MPAGADTIAAPATAPGCGAVGILRVSGPAVPAIAHAVLGRLPLPRQAAYLPFRGADLRPLDHGIALFFPAPNSFTGEDVLELQGHGGPLVTDLLLHRLVDLGARVARPGEFSERAFLHGKIDLSQAEAIADLIAANSAQAARAACRSLEGAFHRAIEELADELLAIRARVEANIDFSDEEIEPLQSQGLCALAEALADRLSDLLARARESQALQNEHVVVLAGPPNAGKSSLLNALLGEARAIVTPVPGTTRDVLRERLLLEGIPVEIVDTAGLRATADEVERIGVERACAALQRADLVLLVSDNPTSQQADLTCPLPDSVPVLFIHNKIDLTCRQPRLVRGPRGSEIELSALTGAGLDLLRQELRELLGTRTAEPPFLARRRHLDALKQADLHLRHAVDSLRLGTSLEVPAEELRLAHGTLDLILGRNTTQALLKEIFSTFCLGK